MHSVDARRNVPAFNPMNSPDQKKLRLLLKSCAQGFYQQMYFWGKDVLHPNGNQLEAYGFKKSPSKGLKGTSCYTYTSDLYTIELYGSCAGYYSSTTQAVFLRNRCKFYEWLPTHPLIAGHWSRHDLEWRDPQSTFQSIQPLLHWWITYEQWIAERFESSYRQRCFTEWKKAKGKFIWLPPSLAVEWVSAFLQQKDRHTQPKHFIQSQQ